MQAKDLDDRRVLNLIDELGAGRPSRWVFMWDLAPALAPAPYKVVQAKAKALIRRGLVNGCPCGCRGDFVVTDKGHMFLKAAP